VASFEEESDEESKDDGDSYISYSSLEEDDDDDISSELPQYELHEGNDQYLLEQYLASNEGLQTDSSITRTNAFTGFQGYVHNCPAQRLRDLNPLVLESAKLQYDLQLSRCGTFYLFMYIISICLYLCI
jgi:hypothetical protein